MAHSVNKCRKEDRLIRKSGYTDEDEMWTFEVCAVKR